jgi:superfamily II DNA or RNA helicase
MFMASFTLNVSNSIVNLKGNIPPAAIKIMTEVLTYRNDIGPEKAQIFNQIRFFKSKNNSKRVAQLSFALKKLEETEWVCWYKDDTFPTGHLNIVIDVLTAINADFAVVDNRVIPSPYVIYTQKNKPHQPRYYQEEMIKLALANGRGVFESAVGTGKTLVMIHLIKHMGVNTLIVVPSSSLKTQIFDEVYNVYGHKFVQQIESADIKSKKLLKPIRICTIQTIASLQKSGNLKHLIKDVDMILTDEFHHSASTSFTNLLSEIDHIYFRFGFTGTFLRNDNKTLDMWGFLSNALYRYKACQAIADGYLTPVKVKIYELRGKSSPNYQKEYDKNYCGGEEIIYKVLDIVKNVNPKDKILILVNRKDKAGNIFHEVLNAHNIANTYISGDDTSDRVAKAIRDFNDEKINILIGSSIIGEGIDVRSADHLIMAQGGKSPITIVQAVGRLVRLFKNKTIGIVHDFDFIGTKYMSKHLKLRLDIYKHNFQPEIERE